MIKYRIEDYRGKRFGHLMVIEQVAKVHPNSNRFLFQCDCGAVFEDEPSRVISGHKKTCGNCKYTSSRPHTPDKFKEYIGERSGKLVAIDIVMPSEEHPNTTILCQCDCGNTHEVLPYQFKSGVVKSCGCGRAKAGFCDGRSRRNPNLYTLWAQMLKRCENPEANFYYRYGGRGIKVCEEWHDYLKFEEWVESTGGKPKGMSLDRIDNDGDYCPENCRWATQKEQTRNTHRNVNITYNGKTQCLTDWAEELNIPRTALVHRYQRGWSVERMLTTPVQVHKKS